MNTLLLGTFLLLSFCAGWLVRDQMYEKANDRAMQAIIESWKMSRDK